MIQTFFIYTLLLSIMYLLTTYNYRCYRVQFVKTGIANGNFMSDYLLVILFFSIIAGCRFGVGTDYEYYLEPYYYNDISDRLEPIFKWFSNICLSLDLHPTVYFSIIAFVQLSCCLFIFKGNRFLIPLFVVYLFTNGLFGSWMNTIRQDLATCIWLYSIQFARQRKLTKYLICSVICIGFHYSSAILIPLYPIIANGKDYCPSRKVQLIIFTAAIILRGFLESMLMHAEGIFQLYTNAMAMVSGGSYDSYTVDGSLDQMAENAASTSKSGLAFLFKMIVYYVIIIYSERIKHFYNSGLFNTIYNFFFISIVVTYILPGGAFNLARPFQYFVPFSSIVLAYFTYYMSMRLKNVVYFVHDGVFQVAQNEDNVDKRKRDYIIGLTIIIGFIGILYLSILTSDYGSDNQGYLFYFQQTKFK